MTLGWWERVTVGEEIVLNVCVCVSVCRRRSGSRRVRVSELEAEMAVCALLKAWAVPVTKQTDK